MVGLVALVPVSLFAWDSRRRRRRTLVWLAVAIGLHTAWLVLADYAVHSDRGRFAFLY